MRPVLAALAFVISTPALAVCDAAYTHDDWSHDMADVDASMAALKLHDAAVTLAQTRDQLPCLDTVAQRAHLDRFALQMSTLYFYQSEEDSAVRWANLMSTRPAEAPVPAWAEMLDFHDAPVIGGPVEASVVAPRGGAVHMDGERLTAPRAAAEVPHLVQLTDRRGEVLDAWWQDGARFRPDLLGDGLDVGGGAGPTPVALGVGAGALGVTAAVLYGMAGAFGQPVQEGTGTPEALVQARSRANMAVIGAGVAGAGALGLGVTAAVSAKGAGVRVRF